MDLREHGSRLARRAPTSRRAIVLAGALLVLAVVASRVPFTSDAAYSNVAAPGTNSFGTGSVVLTDNTAGVSALNVSGMRPGSVAQTCVRVTYNGTLPASVKVYTSGATATNSLDSYVQVQLEQGAFTSVPPFPACTTFRPSATLADVTLSSLTATTTSFATGLGSWTPGGAASTADFRITITVSSSAPSSVVSSSASANLVWEAQNT